MKQLRFLSYLFVAVSCLIFTSCSDDDPTFEEDQVVGSWTVTKYEGWYNEGNGRVTEDPETYNEGDWVFYFGSNGSGVEYDGWSTNFNWSLVNGNQLVLDFSGEKDSYKILGLTEDGCVIERHVKDENGEHYRKLTLKACIIEM